MVSNTAYRYVGEGEARIAAQTGIIPNTAESGASKSVFYTPNYYSEGVVAKEALQLSSVPQYRVAVNASQASPTYAGNVAESSMKAVEATTSKTLPVKSIRKVD